MEKRRQKVTLMPNIQKILADQLAATESRGDLAAYAAKAALVKLHSNWQDATADGSQLTDLLRDIDDVKQRLDEHRQGILATIAQG